MGTYTAELQIGRHPPQKTNPDDPDLVMDLSGPEVQGGVGIDFFVDLGRAITRQLGEHTLVSEPEAPSTGMFRLKFWKNSPQQAKKAKEDE